MTPPPVVIQWLRDNNMRAIPNDEYIKIYAENVTMKNQIGQVKEYCEALVR
ncbi:hypothetical protein [Alicyclobacillus fastidiosus]|uniref:Ig-like domain-containing protein n=1 Tax=Alicyclobacillus fastidiosus TaxID=392011 RepID=A0ABV5A9U8_9BACL|nr:hypothetical protein [Alicyclobacillus fastidiosus]WEH10961.1 hypothetical protein PYS47_07020 [Alicyclobacillus fastidiosus]